MLVLNENYNLAINCFLEIFVPLNTLFPNQLSFFLAKTQFRCYGQQG